MLGRSALLAATNALDYGNWLGNYSDVSLLLRNGTPQLIPFDESPTPKTITAVGNASVTTAVARWNQGSGGSSLAFDGSGDWFTVASSADLSLGTGNFTVEMWAYANNTATRYGLVGNRTGSGGDGVWCIILNPANVAGFGFIYFHTDITPIFGSSVNFSAGIWMHIAVTRSGTSMRMFLNGTEVATANSSANLSASTLHVGVEGSRADQSSPLNGYIDDLRITKGIARYTSNFTPPPAELPNF